MHQPIDFPNCQVLGTAVLTSLIYQLNAHLQLNIYIYYYVSDLSYTFGCILYHPQGDLLSLSQNSLLIECCTLVTKYKIYHMWILQCYLQLSEQYCLVVMP